jgi:hypothetical protein
MMNFWSEKFLTNKFARRFVIQSNLATEAAAIISHKQRWAAAPGRMPRLLWETTMKNTIVAIAGSTLIALSTVQLAAATEQHHRHHRVTEFRDSNALVAPADEATRYSYGWSAPAGR